MDNPRLVRGAHENVHGGEWESEYKERAAAAAQRRRTVLAGFSFVSPSHLALL